MPLPYDVIIADPPWKFANRANRMAPKYPLMELDEIMALPVSMLAAECAMLILWVPPAIQHSHGFPVVERWGFTPKTELIWCKTTKIPAGGRVLPMWEKQYNIHPKIGGGNYLRSAHEKAIVAVRGFGAPMKLIKNYGVPTYLATSDIRPRRTCSMN